MNIPFRFAILLLACPPFTGGALAGDAPARPPAPAPSAASTQPAAALRLADPFGDDMVLQRDMPVPVWGLAAPGDRVEVAFAGQTRTATADAQGRWKVELAPLAASSENRTLTILDGGRRAEVRNVLVGEVWICSGQSNMEMGVMKAANAKAEIAAADFPAIRLRVTSKTTAPFPVTRLQAGPWRACSPASLMQGTWGGFSATAYYFGREVHRELKVPVGLIQSAWGGTYIEPWITPEGFRGNPQLKAQSQWLDKADADYRAAAKACLEHLPAWEKAARAALADGSRVPPLAGLAPPIQNERQPTALYNAMIAPWTGFPVRGAIWYQGESNHMAHDKAIYAEKMAALADGWRKAWGRSEAQFPFYFTQIAPYHYGSALGEFWEAQEAAAQKIPNAGLAHTQDLGNAGNIHPLDKQDVGRRLARLALARTYGVRTQGGAAITDDSGPECRSLEAKGDRLVVKFANAKSGLVSRDGKPLTHFEIAGKDGVFAPAEAQISGDCVILSSAKVAAPTAVRFAESDTANPNLINGDKLPAAAFRASVGPAAK